MTKLGQFLNDRQRNKIEYDIVVFGTSFIYMTDRSKFNPMRYILGRIKIKRIDPRKMLIKRYGDNKETSNG